MLASAVSELSTTDNNSRSSRLGPLDRLLLYYRSPRNSAKWTGQARRIDRYRKLITILLSQWHGLGSPVLAHERERSIGDYSKYIQRKEYQNKIHRHSEANKNDRKKYKNKKIKEDQRKQDRSRTGAPEAEIGFLVREYRYRRASRLARRAIFSLTIYRTISTVYSVTGRITRAITRAGDQPVLCRQNAGRSARLPIVRAERFESISR